MSKIPTSLFSRSSKLLGLASRIAIDEIKDRVKTWEDDHERLLSKVKQAQDIVSTLSQLKGASMKVGQLLSIDLGDYLPPEMVKVLEQLQNKTSFRPFEEIEDILKSELKTNYHDFSGLSPVPIAAASIGQVHRAQLDNEEVVIKVQYPKVAETIPSDLRILELLLKQGSRLFQRSEIDFGPLLTELKEVFILETDYSNEKRMIERYTELFEGSPYIIPKVYSTHSTQKVLTLQYIDGESVGSWIEKGPSEKERLELADVFIKLYLKEIFLHRLVQTDPNPGNFLITKEGKLALLDFGAVREYSADFVAGYRNILLAAEKKDTPFILEESIRIGFLDAREDEFAKESYIQLIDYLASPFRTSEKFDFKDQSFFNKSRDLSLEMGRRCKFTPPPRELTFLHRKLGGIFHFMKKLDIKISLRDYWKYVEDPSLL